MHQAKSERGGKREGELGWGGRGLERLGRAGIWGGRRQGWGKGGLGWGGVGWGGISFLL